MSYEYDSLILSNFLTEVLTRRNALGYASLDEAIQSAAIRRGVDWFRMLDPLYEARTQDLGAFTADDYEDDPEMVRDLMGYEEFDTDPDFCRHGVPVENCTDAVCPEVEGYVSIFEDDPEAELDFARRFLYADEEAHGLGEFDTIEGAPV